MEGSAVPIKIATLQKNNVISGSTFNSIFLLCGVETGSHLYNNTGSQVNPQPGYITAKQWSKYGYQYPTQPTS